MTYYTLLAWRIKLTENGSISVTTSSTEWITKVYCEIDFARLKNNSSISIPENKGNPNNFNMETIRLAQTKEERMYRTNNRWVQAKLFLSNITHSLTNIETNTQNYTMASVFVRVCDFE